MSEKQSAPQGEAGKAEDAKHAKEESATEQFARTKEESAKKETAQERKEREKAEKKAQEQAERDEADIETFLSAHRGERLLRGVDGAFDHVAFEEARRAEQEAAEEADEE